MTSYACSIIVNSVFGIVLEEIERAIKSYRPTANFFDFLRRNENAEFDDLKEEDKKIVVKFFERREKEDVVSPAQWFFGSSGVLLAKDHSGLTYFTI